MSTIEVRVEKRVVEADDIVSLELRAVSDATLPPFLAGAHIDVHLPNGLVRQYSLCNASADSGRYVIAVLREPNSRGGSAAAHEAVAVGDILQISSPKNHFPLSAATRSVLIAGGIGVTPLISMAWALHASGEDFELHYCARSKSRTAFREQLLASPFSRRVEFYFDDQGDSIRINELLGEPEPETHIYVCGPAGFIEFVRRSVKQLGWADSHVHFEFFAAPQCAMEGDSLPFEIEIVSTGARLAVPEGRSAADVLYENGFEIPLSCEQGVCGTCVMRVMNGIPDHRDMFLSDEEKSRNDKFMPCCSRALSRVLVLDL
ncbi:PDR/VanB family oxidoreductase [Paraburkholderia sp. 40]|uniref:PDR/VanB family oxidoreductase n=1 Tax=Paraburkholderia sp. 40 TaxID=2991059 RepID=UPI003D262B5F